MTTTTTDKIAPKIQAKRAYKKHECDYTCDRPRCIKRQRDELVKVVNVAAQTITSLQNNVYVLMNEIEDRKTSRHWLLRRLGL
jgi:hypothetical protein